MSASRELKWATDKATTPKELEDASQRFARRIGPKVARVLVLAVTVVVSQGMTGGAALLASRLSTLPSFPDAAALGASQFGLNVANLGQVSAVAVVGGAIVISLPATAVVMAAQDENVIPLEKELHARVSAFYSRKRFFITNSESLTVREWLSTQSFQAQREFGLQAIENIRMGVWR